MTKILTYLYLLLFLLSCTFYEKKTEKRRNCSSKVYNDSILISNTISSGIIIEDLKNKKTIATIAAQNSNCLQPLIDSNNHLYFANTENVFVCLNFLSNRSIWNYEAENNIIKFDWVDTNTVILSIQHDGLIILDAHTGKERFKAKLIRSLYNSTSVYDYAFDKNYLYIPNFNESGLTCLSLNNGEQLWNYKSETRSLTQIMSFKNYLFCGVTGYPDKKDGEILLLNKSTGKVEYRDNQLIDLIVPPLIYGENILFYTYDQKLHELNTEELTSKIRLDVNDLGGICREDIFLLDDNLYFTSCNFQLYKLNLTANSILKMGELTENLTAIYKEGEIVKFVY